MINKDKNTMLQITLPKEVVEALEVIEKASINYGLRRVTKSKVILQALYTYFSVCNEINENKDKSVIVNEGEN